MPSIVLTMNIDETPWYDMAKLRDEARSSLRWGTMREQFDWRESLEE